MPDFRLTDGMDFELAGQDETAITGTTVTSDTNAFIKGPWTQLAASTARNSTGVWITACLSVAAPNPDAQYIDIGVGGAGSETVLIPNLAAWQDGSVSMTVFVPISIPSGTRLSARVSSPNGGLFPSLDIYCMLQQEGFASPSPFSRVTAYGAVDNSNNPGGTAVATTATPPAKGAWVQLAASTTNVTQSLIVAVGTTQSFTRGMLDIGVGAGGSEVAVLSDLYVPPPGGASFFGRTYWLGPFPAAVPQGSRLSARFLVTPTVKTAYVLAYGID